MTPPAQGEKKEALYARSQNRKYWGRKWVSPNLETAVSMSMRDHNQNEHTSNGSEAFSLLLKMPWREQICIAIYLCLIETICPKIRAKSLPKNTKSHFRLTCVAQKRLCSSSLLWGPPRSRQFPPKLLLCQRFSFHIIIKSRGVKSLLSGTVYANALR